jgi:hypothetical protein
VVAAQVRNAAGLPALPNVDGLTSLLSGFYGALRRGVASDRGQPLYAITSAQRAAAEGFLRVRSVCLDSRSIRPSVRPRVSVHLCLSVCLTVYKCFPHISCPLVCWAGSTDFSHA